MGKIDPGFKSPTNILKKTCERGCSSCYTLVALSILKNISRLGLLFPIYGKIGGFNHLEKY